VEVDAAFYSTPPGWIGRTVQVQWDGRVVRVIDPLTGELLSEHVTKKRGDYRIPDQDRPRHTPRSTQPLLARCSARIGAHAGSLAEQLYRRDGVVAIAAFRACSAWLVNTA
jgi:hypothetical protein